ncbi:protein GL2-INTERACTING REPRESSOR [Trifolium repens]|nr:protein GL2-INTERACTING REPRESSOR [Trifolium repens]
MNKRERSPTLGMGLSLSQPGTAATSSQSTESFSTEFVHSSEGSCVSCNVAEETKAMLLVGCTRCLMYVMLPEVDPKCPKCKSTMLLDFLNNEEITSRKTST